MIKIIESKITNPKINSNREMIFTVRVKREDYDNELWDSICSLSDNGTPIAIGMEGVEEFKPEKPTIGEKRAKLAGLMQKYAVLINSSEEKVRISLYNKYKINSRTELTEEQLDEEIKSYQVGLNYD